MEYKDYYKIIGVAKDATQDEIKRSYRKLARKFHPDVSKAKDAEKHFKEVGEAYEVLKDPKKRKAYDQLGGKWKAGQEGFQPPPGWNAGFEFHREGFTNNASSSSQFSDFFESLFGRRTGGADARHTVFKARGENSHAKVFIDLEDAYHGATRSLNLQTTVLNKEGHPQLKVRTLNVKIPKGVKEGQNIRLQGQGNPGFGGGLAGDLYLEISFNPHALYKIDGRDVSLELPISPWEAALGGKVQVSTPMADKIDLTIPPCISSGKRMRLKGRGIPGKTPGDFYIQLKIVLPDSLTDKEKSLYKALQEEAGNFNPRVKLEHIHEK